MVYKHGNTGNKNALKYSKPLNTTIQVRVIIDDKIKWIKAADSCGMSLSEFVVFTLNSATKSDEEQLTIKF